MKILCLVSKNENNCKSQKFYPTEKLRLNNEFNANDVIIGRRKNKVQTVRKEATKIYLL